MSTTTTWKGVLIPFHFLQCNLFSKWAKCHVQISFYLFYQTCHADSFSFLLISTKPTVYNKISIQKTRTGWQNTKKSQAFLLTCLFFLCLSFNIVFSPLVLTATLTLTSSFLWYSVYLTCEKNLYWLSGLQIQRCRVIKWKL